MKTIYKSLVAALVIAPTLTGCIEETFPTSTATEEQLGSSAKAAEALLWAIPAINNKYNACGTGYAWEWGYGSMMHLRDVMLADMAIVSSGYNWYDYWEGCTYLGDYTNTAQMQWNYYSLRVLTANNVIGAIDPESADATMLGYLGMGYAFRASSYLDLAQLYEFLPNDKTSPINANGNNVEGLTVPIVTNETTEEEARDNPRVPHAEMFTFIMSDLDKAEQYLNGQTPPSKTLPSLAVVYGLKARAYMWNLDYTKAAEYAQKAITESGATPMSRDEWLSTTTGFNDISVSSWLWGMQTVQEDDIVQTGILNWTSWMSNEAQYGYAAAGPYVMIAAELYNAMNDKDFRKLAFKAPAGGTLEGQEPVIDAEWAADLPEYASYKFRPGSGNGEDYQVGSSCGVPLMRVEEMYLILAEATAQSSPSEGKTILENFMKTYRYSTYSCRASDQQGILDEIFLQKRIELFGEGLLFFDYKRLNKSVTRAYEGSNFNPAYAYNTDGRPAWMNFCIITFEGTNNAGVLGWNNPDPSDLYTPVAF